MAEINKALGLGKAMEKRKKDQFMKTTTQIQIKRPKM